MLTKFIFFFLASYISFISCSGVQPSNQVQQQQQHQPEIPYMFQIITHNMIVLPNSNIISENAALLIDQILFYFSSTNSWPPANSFMELHLFFGPNSPQNHVVYEGNEIYPNVPVVFTSLNNIPIETTAIEVEGNDVLQEVEGVLIDSEN